MASKIYQNYKKNVQIVIWRKFFFVFLHEITLEPIDKDKIGCLEPSLPL